MIILNEIFQNIKRKVKCLDNFVMENFFDILKQEIYYENTFYSFDELKAEIGKIIQYYSKHKGGYILIEAGKFEFEVEIIYIL